MISLHFSKDLTLPLGSHTSNMVADCAEKYGSPFESKALKIIFFVCMNPDLAPPSDNPPKPDLDQHSAKSLIVDPPQKNICYFLF
jgi:hypothetical protein